MDYYELRVFDDGNDKFKVYENVWVQYDFYLGKISLQNVKNPKIQIKSISAWKCIKIKYKESDPLHN